MREREETTMEPMRSEPADGGARECDVLMKGGITSGVVYPLAVCELARVFRLRNVGGTSAGAIAAALSAAAEHARGRAGSGSGAASGFDRLAKLPAWIGGERRMLALFRPDRRTRSLFRLALAALGRHGKRFAGIRRLFAVLRAASGAALISWWFWLPLLGAAPGAVVLAALFARDGAGELGGLAWAGVAAAVLVLLIGWVLGTAVAVALLAVRRVPENLYGLVSGSGPVGPDEVPRLTDWLTDEIDRTAGLPPGAGPLTFGDLWGAGAEPAVNLEMLTTDLTTGGPLRLPRELGRGYFFDPEVMRRLFPERVVAWLEVHPPPEPETPSERDGWQEEVALFRRHGLYPMPAPAELPVVVATRMSLSFPILLSAVPLFALDRSLEEPKPERVWFSDGGITSNFPVHFFDTPLPARPTFGVNLRPFHPRYPKRPDERENVFLPQSNRSGILGWWTRWDGLGGFLGAIKNAMQNWVDNDQLPVPGYRDRVVHVSHDDTEGGLNLDMPPEVLEALSKRGRAAGAELVRCYTTPPDGDRTTSWENHRWVRLRSTLGLLEQFVDELDEEWRDGGYDALLAAHRDAPSYRMTDKQQRLATDRMAGLAAVARRWREDLTEDPNRSLLRGAPNPRPAFRVVPAPDRGDEG